MIGRAPTRSLGGGSEAHAQTAARARLRRYSTPRTSACSSTRDHEGCKPTELAGRLRISKQALNYLLGELERLDYLERQPDPDDQRSKRILLTPRGTAAIHTIREAVDDLETTWAQQLGPEHFEQLRTLLLQLNQQA